MDEKITVTDLIRKIAEDVCNNYCKWPEKWDEILTGEPLEESAICENCPMSKL